MLFIKLTGKYHSNDYIYKVYKNKRHDYEFIESPLSLFYGIRRDEFIYKASDENCSSYYTELTMSTKSHLYRLSDAVLFNNIVHILVTSAGEIDKDGTLTHRLCQLHPVGKGV